MTKAIFVSLGIFLLSGCAMGINHNTTSINGKPYLVETKTYGFLFEEWSKPSTLIPLEEEKEIVMPENYALPGPNWPKLPMNAISTPLRRNPGPITKRCISAS